MQRNDYLAAFCWLIVFSRAGIYVHDALGDVAMLLYVAACFAYAYGWHVILHQNLLRLRLWPAPWRRRDSGLDAAPR